MEILTGTNCHSALATAVVLVHSSDIRGDDGRIMSLARRGFAAAGQHPAARGLGRADFDLDGVD
jgi:hypothetical protein